MAPDRLAQEIEAVLNMRDPGLLVGEFETPLLQELFHERFDSIFEENLRRARDNESSSPGELHPQALAEPDVELASHPALMTQSPVVSRSARERADWDRGAPHDPANGLRW